MDLQQLKSNNAIYASLLPNYKNVYGLNGFQLPSNKDCFFRYMPLSYIEYEQKTNETTFVSPQKWQDTFETRYYNINYNAIGFSEPNIYCMCLTTSSSINEDVMWKNFAKKNEQMVRANFNIKKFLERLDIAANTNNFRVYIGEAVYIGKIDIQKITKKDTYFFPQPFAIEHYLTLMSFKRLAFLFENEVRIFIVPENNSQSDLLKIKHLTTPPLSHITELTLSPFPAFRFSFPQAKANKQQINKRKLKIAKIYGIKTAQSQLYEKCNKCRL